eukprot:403334993
MSTFILVKVNDEQPFIDPKDRPKDLDETANQSFDQIQKYKESKLAKNVQGKIQALKQIPNQLGIAGSLVGFVSKFFSNGFQPDPEILKLEQTIREIQTMINLGNVEISNAIIMLSSIEAQRQVHSDIQILNSLEIKHIINQLNYEQGSYDVLCGPDMNLCNNAFIDLCNHLDEILDSSFYESPRGDKDRVNLVGDNLIELLTNSFYTLSWLNSVHYKIQHPEIIIDKDDTNRISAASQSVTFKYYYEHFAVAAYEKWTDKMKFQSCALCTSCGLDYPNYGGEGFKQDDWGHWLRFREQCSGDLYSESGPPQLCCSADLPPVQYCRSCGGDYSYQIGRKINRDDWGPYNIRQDGCQGGYYHTSDEFSLCARNRRQCKMCGGNCNNGYAQMGKVERIDDWGIWGVYDENACHPDNNGDINTERSADVSFCCLNQAGSW